MRVTGRETRRCPANMQERLTRTFGTNIFGEPNFKIVWGASEFIRQGNVWRDRQGTERRGYRERYLGHGMPCWCILRWKSPQTFGHPEVFYHNNFVPHTGLSATGEYPYTGRYEVLQALNYKEFVGGKMVIHNMPLTHLMIDMIIPMLMKAENLTHLEQIACELHAEKVKERQRKQEIDDVASEMLEALPTAYGPISYTGQGIRTSFISRKMEQIQKIWNRLARFNMGKKTRLLKGIQTGNKPRIAY